MAYIFLDESGDLGFGKRSSQYFIITIVICDNPRILEKIIKKTRKTLHKKHKNLHELHANRADDVIRKRVLTQITSFKEIAILSVIVLKKNIPIYFQSQKHSLYIYLSTVLIERLYISGRVSIYHKIDIIFDQKDTNKHLREELKRQILERFKNKQPAIHTIDFKNSHNEKSLQVADFVSWALFRKYEQNESYFYDLIASSILEEFLIFD